MRVLFLARNNKLSANTGPVNGIHDLVLQSYLAFTHTEMRGQHSYSPWPHGHTHQVNDPASIT